MDGQIRSEILEYSCVVCHRKGFKLQICRSCDRMKLCWDPACQVRHDAVCTRTDRSFISDCEVDMGRILEIQEIEEDAGRRVLDLGSSKSCNRHGHNQHRDYIDFTQFTIDHLPQGIRHPAMFQYIVSKALLTVRITSNWTSKCRPDSDPYAHQRGTRKSRVATGNCMTSVSAESFVRKICEVSNCHRKADLGHEHYVFAGEVFVYTNRHVVFDEEEMKRTSVEFFFDSYDKAGVVKEYGLKFTYTKFISDRSFFTITIHDESFLKRLLDIAESNILQMFSVSDSLVKNLEPFIIIISHPHGMPKKISIGKVTKVLEENVSAETKKNAEQFGQMYVHWQKNLYDRYLRIMSRQEGKRDEKAYPCSVKMHRTEGNDYGENASYGTGQCEGGDEIQKEDCDKFTCHSDKEPKESEDNVKHNYCDDENAKHSRVKVDDLPVDPTENCESNTCHHKVNNDDLKHEIQNKDTEDHGVDVKDCRRSMKYKDVVAQQGKCNFTSHKQDYGDSAGNCSDSVKNSVKEFNVGNGERHRFNDTNAVLDSAGEADSGKDECSHICTENAAVSGDADGEGNRNEESERVDFMSTASFPVVTVFHNGPTCQGSSGGPVIHKGFCIGPHWLPLTGGHLGYDLNVHHSFFRYNKPIL